MELDRGQQLKPSTEEFTVLFCSPSCWKGQHVGQLSNVRMFHGQCVTFLHRAFHTPTHLQGQAQKSETFLALFLVITAIPKDKLREATWELCPGPVKSRLLSTVCRLPWCWLLCGTELHRKGPRMGEEKQLVQSIN